MRELSHSGECVVCGNRMRGGPHSYSDLDVSGSYCAGPAPTDEVAPAHRHVALAHSSRSRFGPLLLGGPGLHTPGRSSLTMGRSEVGRRLDACANRGVIALHDRFMPGYSGTIAEMAIGPSGVYVIGVKEQANSPLERAAGPGLQRRSTRFVPNDWERYELVLNMAWQMDMVRSALDGLLEARGAPGQPMLALIGAKRSLLRSAVDIDGVLVAGPQKIAKIVSRPGKLSRSTVAIIAEHLALELPPA